MGFLEDGVDDLCAVAGRGDCVRKGGSFYEEMNRGESCAMYVPREGGLPWRRERRAARSRSRLQEDRVDLLRLCARDTRVRRAIRVI